MALADLFADVADAIREKNGTADPIAANDFPARIRDIETGYRIDLSVDPPDGGTVSGGGRASAGVRVTVGATANEGNKFAGWYENGSMVSRNASYSFNVVKNRILKAKINLYDFWFKSASLPKTTSWMNVAYGDGKFVAVGGSSNYGTHYFAYSTDGINWTLVDSPIGVNYFFGVIAYGNGKFVVRAESHIYYSTDGINWSFESAEIDAIGKDITYGDGKFVILYNFGFYYSTDGINWTEAYSEPGSSAWECIAYGGGKFVAAGANVVAYSSDGINWTKLNTPIDINYYRLVYGDGKFVAVGYDIAAGANVVAYSTDGINWTKTYLPQKTRAWGNIAYGGGKFVVITGSNTTSSSDAAYSTDLINWTETYLPRSDKWTGIAYGGDKFVAVAHNSSYAAYSTQRDQTV